MSTNLPSEDFRISQARETLERTAIGHDTFGTATAQLYEVRAVLGDLLTFVAEKGAPIVSTGEAEIDQQLQLDRIEDVANRTWSVVHTAPAFGERLDRIEERLGGIESVLSRELDTLSRVIGGEQ